MSLETTILFDSEASFTFDNTKIEFVGDSAQLKQIDLPGQVHTQDFSSNTGMVYDAVKSIFTGGKLKQVDRRPAGALAYFPFVDKEAAWASGTYASAFVNSAVITGGRLDLVPNLPKFELTAAGAILGGDTLCLRFDFYSKYTGNPGTAVGIVQARAASGSNNSKVTLTHATNSQLQLSITNDAGVAVLTALNLGVLSMTAATKYTLELYVQFTGAACKARLFVNGLATSAEQSVASSSVNNNRTYLVFGNNGEGAVSNFQIDNFVSFNTIPHNADHASDLPYVYQDTIYTADKITIPAFVKTGTPDVGITAITANSVVTSGSVKFSVITSLGSYYWTGAAWAVSNGTYAQASTFADLMTNFLTLPMGSSHAFNLNVHFDNLNTISEIDNLSFTYTTKEYSRSIVSISPNTTTTLDDLFDISADYLEEGDAHVGFTLEFKGAKYYWTGAAWAISDQSISQVNSMADIIENFVDLDLSSGGNFKVITYLWSTGGLSQSSINEIFYSYDFFSAKPSDVNKCAVYCYIDDFLQEQDDFSNAKLIVTLESSFSTGTKIILGCTKTADFNNQGFAQLTLAQTATWSKKYIFMIQYICNGKTVTIEFKPAIVPDQASINLLDLTAIG